MPRRSRFLLSSSHYPFAMSFARSLARQVFNKASTLRRTRQTIPSLAPSTQSIAINHLTRSLSTANSPTPQTGFSYPGPRKLNEIVKLQLLNKHGAPRVTEIWNEYHRDHKTAVGDVLTDEEYSLLKGRTQRCRHFVLPIPRGFFTLLVQFQGQQCFMTYLEDYKNNAGGAQPWLTLTLFEELLETKNMVLLRGEVTNMLTRQEAKVLIELVKQFYLGQGRNYDTVVAFNEASENFDFKTVLRAAGIGS